MTRRSVKSQKARGATMSRPIEPKRSIVTGDAEYLKALSGYKQKTSVARWCRKNKIKFFLNGQGWPVSSAEAINQALLGGGKESGPDWGAFELDPNSTHWRHRQRRGREAAKAAAAALPTGSKPRI
jgi:hypothetical protein